VTVRDALSALGRRIYARELFDTGSSRSNSARTGDAPEEAGLVVSTDLGCGVDTGSGVVLRARRYPMPRAVPTAPSTSA
jgi:hypothetical protein